MVSPSARRRAVRGCVEAGLCAVAAACRAVGLSRSGFYRDSLARPESRRAAARILQLSGEHPRYGYRRIGALMRREGWRINDKRVQRLRRREGLQVSKRQRRTRRLGSSASLRQQARAANEVWSWDFVEDQTENGSRLRLLTLIDEHTRRCLAIHADRSIRAVDAITVIEAAIGRYGAPRHIRSDNGPEFIAYAIRDWLGQKGIGSLYIQPGSPWEQAHIESFHDKLRDECLNRELFGSLREARVILEQWRVEYNERRPHSSLGYLTPGEFAARNNPGLRSPSGLPAPRIAKPQPNGDTTKPVELQF